MKSNIKYQISKMWNFRNFTFCILIFTFLLVGSLSAATSAPDISGLIGIDKSDVTVRVGEQVLMRYCYEGVPFKPYVQQLYSPKGVNVLRDAPADHLHHHALMYAVAVDGVNCWEETQTAGRQKHEGFGDVRVGNYGGLPSASFSEQIRWTDFGGHKLLLKERRTIKVCQNEDLGATVLIWRSCFEVPQGKESVTLSGSHYFGLGMRFLESMDGVGQFSNADGKEGTVFRGDERLVRSAWCAYAVGEGGAPVTVAMLGHPGNVRSPTTWFTMVKPFAYLSATVSLHSEALVVNSAKPLALQYAVVIWDGQVEKERIDRVYRWFVDKCSINDSPD